ncbi:RNA polymerase sigma-70 factor [Mucilaginibacter sp.]|jgi:RNA polymerase sigma-70 factor (ECF subfamily)|uniref:RNA polymerase sigma-70 factor n=1 Tax=Mucilaginibacter sp. TaxID=1882438 RepID=UPI00356B4D6E
MKIVNESSASEENSKEAGLFLKSVFNEYYERLVYFSDKIVRDITVAEDIVQEALIKYWENKAYISDGHSYVKSYLYTTVKNLSINSIRHQQVIKKFEEQHVIAEIDDNTIDNIIIQTEIFNEIHKAIDLLPGRCREISHMGFIVGMKNQEIAKELGISVNTVKTQKQRAIKILRLKFLTQLIFQLLLLFLERH